jgi:hypothetical protein
MQKLLQSEPPMVDKEFEAPDWVQNNEELKPLTPKQKRYFLAVLAVVIPFCMWAGWFEWHRAHEGHWRAWVYTFEWPFFAGVSLYMYRRFLIGDRPKVPRPNLDQLDSGEDR